MNMSPLIRGKLCIDIISDKVMTKSPNMNVVPVREYLSPFFKDKPVVLESLAQFIKLFWFDARDRLYNELISLSTCIFQNLAGYFVQTIYSPADEILDCLWKIFKVFEVCWQSPPLFMDLIGTRFRCSLFRRTFFELTLLFKVY